MLIKKWIFWIVMACLYPILGYAANTQKIQPNCILMGPAPSLIIKFSNISSANQPQLAISMVSRLSGTNASFTSARSMAYGDYVLFFTPKSSMVSQQAGLACYSEQAINALIEEVKSKAKILYAVPNKLNILSVKSSLFTPTVGAKQWNLKAPPGGINAQAAWAATTAGTGSPNAIVAVLDSGILPNISLTPNVLLPGVTFNNAGTYSIGAAPSCDSSCSGYDHGTHVSGIVAASGVTAYGENIFGVAPTAKVLPINVFTKYLNCDGHGTACIRSTDVDETNALAWLNGTVFSGLPTAPLVTTVNMSIGSSTPSPCSIAFQNALNISLSKNISFAISAGNGMPAGTPTDASNSSPANCTGVMAVAATGPDGYGAFYSNYGAIIPFAAPGGSAPPPLYDTALQIYSTLENSYGYDQGTSMASPHVAGLSALLYSIDPTLTPTLVKNLISSTTTAFPAGGPGYSCVQPSKPCGTGIINANNAVLAAVAQAPIMSWAPNPIATPTATQASVNWTAAAWNPARSTPIIYTLSLDGTNYGSCIGIFSLTCTLTNLVPSTTYHVYIKATDIRSIYGPNVSSTINFTTNPAPFAPPTITYATRNPAISTQAYIYYSSLGVPQAPSFLVGGAQGATIILDSPNNRFVVSNTPTSEQINYVTVIGTNGLDTIASNAISIPAAYSPPAITFAVRNPLLSTQAFIFYSSLGVPQAPTFIVGGLAGSSVVLDLVNSRFVVSNIPSSQQYNNVSIIGTDGFGDFRKRSSIPIY